MRATTPPFAHPQVVLREEFDDWAILYDPDTAATVGINPTGVAIWKQINGKKRPEDFVQSLIEEFDTVPEEVPGDVEKFLDLLESKGFIGYEVKPE